MQAFSDAFSNTLEDKITGVVVSELTRNRKRSGSSKDQTATTESTVQTITPTTKNEEERLMDLDEVAEKLGNISNRTVRRLINRGDLPRPVKVLSAPRLYYSDVVAYMERLRQKRDQSTRNKGIL